MAAAAPTPLLRLTFVCYGNICRSPVGEAVLAAKVRAAALQHLVHVNSCGTYGHDGWPADARSVATASARGYTEISRHRGRCLDARDYDESDLLLALDTDHVEHMLRHAPPAGRRKVRLLMDAVRGGARGVGVPDPYYGSAEDFEAVHAMIETATDALLAVVQAAVEADDPRAALLAALPAPHA